MRHAHRRIAAALIASLLWMNAVEVSAQSDHVIREQIELFGPGTEVKLKLANGKVLQGSIGLVDRESFELISKQNHDRMGIAYRAVAQFEVRKKFLPGAGDTETEVRRVVNTLGIGRHFEVKTSSGKLSGNVQRTWDDHFELLLDKKWKPVDVAYADVRELSVQPVNAPQRRAGPNMGKVIFMSFAFFMIVVAPIQCSLRKDCHI